MASILGIGESTLRLWAKTGKPDVDVGLGRPAPLFYGTTVADEDALGDLVELFGASTSMRQRFVETLRTLGARWDLATGQRSR